MSDNMHVDCGVRDIGWHHLEHEHGLATCTHAIEEYCVMFMHWHDGLTVAVSMAGHACFACSCTCVIYVHMYSKATRCSVHDISPHCAARQPPHASLYSRNWSLACRATQQLRNAETLARIRHDRRIRPRPCGAAV